MYRDEETVRASEAAARFALITERDEQILQRSRKYDSQYEMPLSLSASFSVTIAGDLDCFLFLSTRHTFPRQQGGLCCKMRSLMFSTASLSMCSRRMNSISFLMKSR